jgi:hypothetical protein
VGVISGHNDESYAMSNEASLPSSQGNLRQTDGQSLCTKLF